MFLPLNRLCLRLNLLALLGGFAVSVPAASIYQETFSGGLAGWTGEGTGGGQVVVNAIQDWVEVQIPIGHAPLASGKIIATNQLAACAAFLGDFDAVGGRVLGFSFLAENLVPSELELRWVGAGNNHAVELSSFITELNHWYHFTVSLASVQAGPWGTGTPSSFEASLQDVERLQILVGAAGIGFVAQTYRIDNVHLSPLPTIASLSPGSVQHELVVSNLHPGLSYEFAYRDLISGEDTLLASFEALASQETLAVPADGSGAETIFLRFTNEDTH